MIGSIKCRLKSSSAWSGVGPKPLAPGRNFVPIKASQRSPTIPILGRNRAAGLRGWCSRNSSISCFIAVGSSSIASEVTLIKTALMHSLDFKSSAKNPQCIIRATRGHAPHCESQTHRNCFRIKCFWSGMRAPSLRESGSQLFPGSYVSDQSRPQSIATEVVRLPPMLNVRNFFAFSIWRAPACSVSC
jgi:hypothetical protein